MSAKSMAKPIAKPSGELSLEMLQIIDKGLNIYNQRPSLPLDERKRPPEGRTNGDVLESAIHSLSKEGLQSAREMISARRAASPPPNRMASWLFGAPAPATSAPTAAAPLPAAGSRAVSFEPAKDNRSGVPMLAPGSSESVTPGASSARGSARGTGTPRRGASPKPTPRSGSTPRKSSPAVTPRCATCLP